ncbi:hypothetical protein BX616_009821, partial [Lobosporangium transversale]
DIYGNKSTMTVVLKVEVDVQIEGDCSPDDVALTTDSDALTYVNIEKVWEHDGWERDCDCVIWIAIVRYLLLKKPMNELQGICG